jgi:outer membrane lipoprotein LolB
MLRGALRVGIAALALWLGACATPTAPPERVYSGRFAATAANGERRESVSGLFTLEVRGTRQTIDLATPVGTTVARIEIESGRATATGPQMQKATGPDADLLVESLIGWRLPVSGLADWIDGRPTPDRPATTRRDGERISEIVQDGWTIRYAEFSTVTQRPRRLLLERASAGASPALSVRLIVDEPVP